VKRHTPYDLLVVGGGINGAGIARDAAGRGLSVLLAERHDLAAATSSASSKLIHGGLRYLEHGALRLVRESLGERTALLRLAPHLVRPLDFVLPAVPGGRPALLLRLGLFLYDRLAGRGPLPPSAAIDLASAPEGRPLLPAYRRGFRYADCRVDDARLVVANALDAAARGADILTRTEVAAARPADGLWQARLRTAGSTHEVAARVVVNAAGPWVHETLTGPLGLPAARAVRLVRGSHIVVPRLYDGPHAYILQQPDRRVVFVIPYERSFTLIGTTDVPVDSPGETEADAAEVEYLCGAVGRFLARPVAPADAVWRYAGIRPLYDDGRSDASAVTRDYALRLDLRDGLPALNVYGGKLTTYRRLAEHVLAKLAPHFPGLRPAWTATAALPGGDLPDGPAAFAAAQAALRPGLPAAWLEALVGRHGSRAPEVLGEAQSEADLGRAFGGGLYERELAYLIEREWAREADDVLWRRGKFGLHMRPGERDALARRMAGG